MKKVLALVMCIAMIASFAVTASAADYTVTYTVSSYEGAKVGDTVTVTVSLSKNADLGALEFNVDIDDEYLEATSITNSRGKQQWYAGINPVAAGSSVMGSDGLEAESGQYKFAFANADGIYEEGALVEFYVKVVKDLPEEGAAINLIVNATTHYEDNKLTYENKIVNGVVKGVKEDIVVPPTGGGTTTPPTGGTTTPPVEESTTDIPETGDATGIAVAAGLCAVMAAAFVITKKVND